jgi:hypothetical protein
VKIVKHGWSQQPFTLATGVIYPSGMIKKGGTGIWTAKFAFETNLLWRRNICYVLVLCTSLELLSFESHYLRVVTVLQITLVNKAMLISKLDKKCPSRHSLMY